MTTDEIGEWIKRSRDDLGLKYTELERITGVSESSLRRMEGGNAAQSIGNVIAVVETLGGRVSVTTAGEQPCPEPSQP